MGSVYKQPETGEDNPDTAGGCQVSRRGHKGGAKGNQQRGIKARGIKARGIAPCICVNVLYVQWNDWKFE
jgi:hypothetical protein